MSISRLFPVTISRFRKCSHQKFNSTKFILTGPRRRWKFAPNWINFPFSFPPQPVFHCPVGRAISKSNFASMSHERGQNGTSFQLIKSDDASRPTRVEIQVQDLFRACQELMRNKAVTWPKNPSLLSSFFIAGKRGKKLPDNAGKRRWN